MSFWLLAPVFGENTSAPRILVWVSGRKPGGVTQVCNSTTQNVETRGSRVQGHPLLHSELEASLGYMKPYLRKQRKTLPPKMEPFQPHMRGDMPISPALPPATPDLSFTKRVNRNSEWAA